MPKVFPIHETKFPLNSAREFGDLQKPLFTDLVYPTGKGGKDLEEKKLDLIGGLIMRLRTDFDPQHDFLLIVGDPIFIGLAFSVARELALEAEVEQLNTLRYDKALGRYLDIEVEL